MLEALTFSGAVDNLIGLMRPLVALIIGLALVYFLWGVAMFISASGDEKGVEEGRKAIGWGIIALFIMVSIYGIVSLVASSLDLTGPNSGGIPNSGGKPSDKIVEP